jgi:hypothetical protein
MLVVCGHVHAQLSEKFEPRNGETTGVRNILTKNGWSFPEMNLSRAAGSAIEGTQSMVTPPLLNPKGNAGFYTPFVWVQPGKWFQFSYKFLGLTGNNTQVWLKLMLEDEHENLQEIYVEAIALKTSGLTQQFNYRFSESDLQGAYRIYINLQGKRCESRIAVDNIAYDGLVIGKNPDCETLSGANQEFCEAKMKLAVGQGESRLENDAIAPQPDMRLFPNPNSGKFTLEGKFSDSEKARFALYDVLGKEVWSATRTTSSQTGQYQFDLGAIKPGLYFFRAISGGKTVMQRFQIK